MQSAPPASAAGDPPAAKPTSIFGEHVQEGGRFKEGWAENLRAAGFERLANKAMLAADEPTFLRTLDETIGFVGKKAVGVSYPKPGASDEEISAFRREAGVPDSPEAYALKPESLPEGVEWSEDLAKPYAEIFHRHHVPAAAAQELLAKHLESVAAQQQQSRALLDQRVSSFAQESEKTFAQEWGDTYDSRLEANRAFVAARMTPEELADPILQAALSHPKIVRFIDESRRALREAPLPGVGAEVQANSMSAREQARQIMASNPNWKRDPEVAKRVQDLYALDAQQQKRKGR